MYTSTSYEQCIVAHRVLQQNLKRVSPFAFDYLFCARLPAKSINFLSSCFNEVNINWMVYTFVFRLAHIAEILIQKH